jgi:hypothetical protein
MERARTETAGNPDAGKARVDKTVRHKDRVEDVADVARVPAAAAVADKARARVKVVVVAVGAGKIANAARNDAFLTVTR